MKVAIGVGLMEFPFQDPRTFWKWIDMCEAGGIDSFWQTDRLISTRPILECMSVLAAVAGATKRMQFGMNVASLAFRDPVLLAKQCATIDVLSEGRMLPAFGIGSPHSPDWRATNTSPRRRGKRTDEALDIITALWRGERVSFDSEFYKLDDAIISPLPFRKRFPVWIGGSSDAAINRTARIGTGWLGGRETPADAGRVVKGIKAKLLEYDRKIDDDHYGASFNYHIGKRDNPAVAQHLKITAERTPDRDPNESLVVGEAQAVTERIREFVDAGVTKFIVRPVDGSDDALLAQTRLLIEKVLPEVDRMNAS